MSLFRRRTVYSRPVAVFALTEVLQSLVDTHRYRFGEFRADPDGRVRHLSIEVDPKLTVTITQEQP